MAWQNAPSSPTSQAWMLYDNSLCRTPSVAVVAVGGWFVLIVILLGGDQRIDRLAHAAGANAAPVGEFFQQALAALDGGAEVGQWHVRDGGQLSQRLLCGGHERVVARLPLGQGHQPQIVGRASGGLGREKVGRQEAAARRPDPSHDADVDDDPQPPHHIGGYPQIVRAASRTHP